MYELLKLIHVSAVALSGSGFLLRGVWMLRRSSLLQARLTRVLPHLIDTILLASAIGMLVTLRMNPLDHAWLLAKIGGLLVYILLGAIALKRGKTYTQRAVAFLLAACTFAYIISVAISKQPLPLN